MNISLVQKQLWNLFPKETVYKFSPIRIYNLPKIYSHLNLVYGVTFFIPTYKIYFMKALLLVRVPIKEKEFKKFF